MSHLGIDLGTSGVRAGVFSDDGVLLAEHTLRTPLSRRGSLVETDAEAVTKAACEAIAAVSRLPAVIADPITALSFSTQGEAVVPVGDDGRALAGAPVSMDGRGAEPARDLARVMGEDRFQEITGQPLHRMFSVFKVAAGHGGWSGPEVRRYETLDVVVARALGASAVTDFSMAARTGGFDVDRRTWSDEILSSLGQISGIDIDADLLPDVVAPGQVIGAVDAQASAATGVSPGTPIVAGVHDQAASFLGAGGCVGGPSVYALGSSDCLTVLSSERTPELRGTGFATYPLGTDAWIALAGTAAGGWALEWLADLLQEPISDLFDTLDPEPSRLLVLPYFAGSSTLQNDPAARGVIAGLTLRTSRAEIARAFLESTGYDLAILAAAFEARGFTVGEIRAVGSGASNAPALRIRASASGRSLRPVTCRASARGAALLAGMGRGTYGCLGDFPEPQLGQDAAPQRRHTAWYEQQRAAFTDLFESTRTTVHRLTDDMETPS